MKKLLIILLFISCQKDKEFVFVHDDLRLVVDNQRDFADLTYYSDQDTIYCSLTQGVNSIIIQRTKHLMIYMNARYGDGYLGLNVLKRGESVFDTVLTDKGIIQCVKYVYIGDF